VPLVRDAADALRPLAAEKGLKLEADVPAHLPHIDADRGRCFKCSPTWWETPSKPPTTGGRIVLGAGPKDRDVHFWVADTGAESIGTRLRTVRSLLAGPSNRKAGCRARAFHHARHHSGARRTHLGRERASEGAGFHFTLPVANPASS
jgi:hypothetical protein